MLCHRDMHAIYQRYQRLQPSDRVQECMLIKFTMNDHLLQSPNEGMFWQADHVLPVAEGGGECTMENIRTLCTTCHQKETNALRRRLRDAKLGASAKGTLDIRGFFGGGAGKAGKASTTKKKAKNRGRSAKSGNKRATEKTVEKTNGGDDVVDLTL